ncbi:MAG: ABC transporter ATP-binding protein [Rhodospirillales bacterium]|jgi:ATP-binding cassette subfamily B protein|nr:ABC transporter ATP-binding protein [Rhodospirillales bacterium]MDP6882911.1 ABC transporter ATP-binding protein [Rhodospirillales bacterium]
MAVGRQFTANQAGERPPRAVVGSQVGHDEQMFGAAFDGHVVRRFAGYLRPYRRRLAVAVGSVLVYTASQIAIPLVIRHAIDDALIAGTDRELLELVVVAFFAVIGVNYLTNFLQEIIVGRVAERILIDLRRAMFEHLQRVGLSFMDKTEVGRMMSRLQGDVNAMQEFLENSVFAVGDFVLLIGIMAVLLALDWQLGLLTLSVVPILFIVRIIWLPYARKSFVRARETVSTANGALAEAIHGMRTVQSMTRETVNFDLYDEKATDNLLANLSSSRFAQVMVPIVDFLTGGAMAIVIVVGGSMVLSQRLDLGVMVAFLFYVQRFFDPIRSLTMQYSVMQRAMASGQRAFEVLDVPLDIKDKPDSQAPVEIDGSVEFKGVTFGYAPDQPVLRNVNFRIEPGETVALVGPTGSGKTSTTSLAHRFYDVWEGQVLVGGIDVRDMTQASLGRHVAMVLQEPFLFTGTVFENIRYRTTEATREGVEAAARAVGAHDFITRLPRGYDTPLEQRGSNLSLGQRQLLSFARAIVADARVLILDEATANIDSHTEMLIQRALARLLEGRTGLVIAHRLATVRGADRIIVLQDGEIIETGNHDQLVEHGGLYAKLYSMNYASFDDVPDELVRQVLSTTAAT